MTSRAVGLALIKPPVLLLLATVALGVASPTALAAGDPEAGKAQAITCAACHGQDGASGIDPTYPHLAGQNERYLFEQLKLIQSNDREILLMAGQLNGKSEQDLMDLAAYYASLPKKGGQAQGDDDAIARADKIYRGGNAARAVAACAACHGPRGSGNAPAGFPKIGGQPAGYTVNQLTNYREGARGNYGTNGTMMQGVARGLTDGEIAIIADYLQGLH